MVLLMPMLRLSKINYNNDDVNNDHNVLFCAGQVDAKTGNVLPPPRPKGGDQSQTQDEFPPGVGGVSASFLTIIIIIIIIINWSSLCKAGRE